MPKDVREFSLDRPEFYDRHATDSFTQAQNANTTPHADTLFNAYTVPTGRAWIGTAIAIGIRRKTVATTSGEFYMRLVLPQVVHELRDFNNVVGTYSRLSYPCFSFAKAGTTVNWRGRDLSVGGTLDWFCNADGFEFDA